MLRLVNLEEIQGLLLRVPALIDDLEKRRPRFADAVKAWLAAAEQVLLNNRMPAAAEVAVLRGVLIGAGWGVLPTGLAFRGRVSPRKVQDASAADVLRKAEEVIAAVTRGPAQQFAEAEQLARQLAALAVHKRLVPAGQTTSTHAQTLKALWDAMTADPDLGPATVRLAAMVGPYDALILLDRALPAPGAAR